MEIFSKFAHFLEEKFFKNFRLFGPESRVLVGQNSGNSPKIQQNF